MLYLILGGVILLSYTTYFYRRYVIRRIVCVDDKTVQTIVETISLLHVSEPSSPMSIQSTDSALAFLFDDYKIKTS